MAGANKVPLDRTVSTIIKEEFMIPDDPELHIDQKILVDTSCEQIRTTEPVGKREKDFVKKIKNRIQALNKINSSNDVEITFEKSSVPVVNACAPMCDNLKSLNNSITVGQGAPLQAETSIKRTSEKSNKSEMKNLTLSPISILKSQATIKNLNAHQNLENSRRRGAATSILKIPNLMNKRTTITISDLPKNKNVKPCLQAESVLKSAIKPVSEKVPLVCKLTKASEAENVKQIVDVEKNKSTLHVLNMKEKQIVITNNNFTEIKKEVVEADFEEQIANRSKRFYHGICFTCRKLKAPNDQNDKCQICLTSFQYECLRCRDILTSKEEYYNHLQNGLYCSEIHVPAFLWNDSYALATRAEKTQCSEAVWERTQELISLVRKARAKLKGKFNRIKSCCLICDTTQHVDHGTFWCMQCNVKSVFKCQTCNRNYTTYSSAIYHTENRIVKKPIFECSNCSFKHRRKRELIIHMRDKHPPMEPRVQKKASLVFQCPDCHLIIRSVSYWRKHAYTCRGKVYFKCTLCSEKYLAKKDIMVHILVAHQMTDSVVTEMMKGIEQDRNNQEEKKKQRKQEDPKPNNQEEKKKQRKQEVPKANNQEGNKISITSEKSKRSFKTFFDVLNTVLEKKKQRKQEVLKLNNRQEKKKQRKQEVVKPNKKCKFYRSRFVNPYCIKCDSVLENLKTIYGINCKKCEAPVGVQCKFCKKFFHKYNYAYSHMNKCEKIASMNKKTDSINKNVTNAKKYRIVNKNTQQLDLGNGKELENNLTLEDTGMQLNDNIHIQLENTNNQFCHSIFGDEAFMSNGNKLDINSTLEDNEMQLDEISHVELEDQDIKVFDGLINFENYEVIIPDKIEHTKSTTHEQIQ